MKLVLHNDEKPLFGLMRAGKKKKKGAEAVTAGGGSAETKGLFVVV